MCHSFFAGAVVGMAYELVMGCIRGTPLETANIVLACQVDGAMEGWGVADELMDGEEGEVIAVTSELYEPAVGEAVGEVSSA